MVHAGLTRGVTEAVTRGVTDARVIGGAAPDAWATLAALLAANSALWRPQVGYCWQDTGRTLPAGIGDPVRVIDDVSGNDLHAVAPADANRGTLAEVDIGGTMYQHVVFDGTDTRYAISVTVTQRTLAVAFDDDGATFAGLYGSGALANILQINNNRYGMRTDSAALVNGDASSLPARSVIARCDATTQRLRVDDISGVSNAATPTSVTFTVIGANTSAGANSATGKYFGGLIMPAYADDTLSDAIQTFIGGLIGKAI